MKFHTNVKLAAHDIFIRGLLFGIPMPRIKKIVSANSSFYNALPLTVKDQNRTHTTPQKKGVFIAEGDTVILTHHCSTDGYRLNYQGYCSNLVF